MLLPDRERNSRWRALASGGTQGNCRHRGTQQISGTPIDQGFQVVVFRCTSLDVSAEVDFAFNDVIQVGAFGRHNGFDLKEALIYGATANYLFDLALRGDTDLLEEFSQRHIESFLVHLLSHSSSCVVLHRSSIWLVQYALIAIAFKHSICRCCCLRFLTTTRKGETKLDFTRSKENGTA